MSDEECAEFNRRKQERLAAMRQCTELSEPSKKKRKTSEAKEENPPRWPAREGLFLILCGFLFGLCTVDEFKQYMAGFGKSIDLNEAQIGFILLLFETEQHLQLSMRAMLK